MCVATAAWFIASSIFISVYGAYFSAETLCAFPHVTRYENMMEFENFILYFLVNNRTCAELRDQGLLFENMCDACYYLDLTPFPECDLFHQTNFAISYYHFNHDVGTETYFTISSGKKRRLIEILENFVTTSFVLCNNPDEIEETVEAVATNGTNAAFITYDYEFQHNYEIFAKIVERRPDWKIVNNFANDDEFEVQETAYYFSNGLHRRFRNRFEGRMKVLVSSGIYWLWSKWQRIRSSLNGLRHYEQKMRVTNGLRGDPMSFQNSASRWLFLAQFMLWFAAVVVFGMERLLTWPCRALG